MAAIVGTASDEDRDEDGFRRWLVLVVAVASASVVVLDTTSANVAVPSMAEDLGSGLSSVLWVITGYSLTFAGLLVVGGRLGDLYGHRRTFIAGASLFATGSLIASVAPSLFLLFVGKALVEGAGAALMLPATIAVLSTVFEGRDRAIAFAAWGTAGGAAGAFGPVVGGALTSAFSWRWTFRLNMIVAAVAIVGAIVLLPRTAREQTRLQIGNALVVSTGLFLVVFGIIQGAELGWLSPTADVHVGSLELWSHSNLVSLVPIAFMGAAALLGCFVWLERRLGRSGGDPLLAADDLRVPAFRYGLLTIFMTATAQFGVIFVLPIFLQEGLGLSARASGLWQLPFGVAVVVGAQAAGRLSQNVAVMRIVRAGVLLQLVGTALLMVRATAGVTFVELMPCLALYGLGVGFVTSQLTNVIVSVVAARRVGVAGATTMTLRQVGAAIGVSGVGALMPRDGTIHSVRPAMVAITAIVLVGAAFSMLLPKAVAAPRTEVLPPA